MKEAFKIVHRARTTAGALSSTAAFSLAEAEKTVDVSRLRRLVTQ